MKYTSYNTNMKSFFVSLLQIGCFLVIILILIYHWSKGIKIERSTSFGLLATLIYVYIGINVPLLYGLSAVIKFKTIVRRLNEIL